MESENDTKNNVSSMGAPNTSAAAAVPFEQRRRQRQGNLQSELPASASSSTASNVRPAISDASTEPMNNVVAEETSASGPTPAPEGPAPPPHHRGVSWGGVEEHSALDLAELTPPSSPAATAKQVYEAAEAAVKTRDDYREADDNRHIKGLSSLGKINFDDLMQIRPIESEAETHILRALEQSDIAEGLGASPDGIITGEVRLLANFPEGAEAMFSNNNHQTSEPDSAADQQRSRNFSIGAYREDDEQSTAPSGTFTTPTVDSVWENTSKRSTMHSTHVGSCSTRYMQQQANYHRRQRTMEETLSSLTNALDDLHRQNRPRTATIDSKLPQPSVDHQIQEPLDSSAEAFAENVNRLFRHGTTGASISEADSEVVPLVGSTGSDRAAQGSTGGADSCSESAVVPSEQDEASESSSFSPPLSPLTPGRSSKARKNWNMLKEAIIQNGPSAALDADVPPPPQMSTIDENGANEEVDIEMGGASGSGSGDSSSPNAAIAGTKAGFFRRFVTKVSIFREIDDFLQPRRSTIWLFVKAMLWVIVPSLVIACLLFYLGNNPPTGIRDRTINGPIDLNQNGKAIDPKKASYSWWILFIGVRQVLTFAMARFMEGFIVEFICLERRWSLNCFGPTITLLIVQSKVWPCTLFFWSLFDLALLYGDHPLAAHWGWWQEWLHVFNESNPSGEIVSSDLYLRIILIVLGISIVVAVKRLLIGYHFGRKLFARYSEDLARVMKKTLLVSQVASLAAQLERERMIYGEEHEKANVRAARVGIDEVIEEGAGETEDEHEDSKSLGSSSNPHSAKGLVFGKSGAEGRPDGVLTHAQKLRIDRLLGNWDEPEANPNVVKGDISIASILQFRTSMAQLGRPFPFSFAFGRASTREECIESSQNVFLRLLAETPGEKSLSFNVLALVALQTDGTLVPEKIRDMVRLFRPNQSGNLTLIDFIRSVDLVYKELRLLRASVRNSQKLDDSFERIFNVIFYIIILCICLAVLGFDPLAIFLSFSSFALAFSFMISRASSNYFEGLLFILARRPYDIGDRIAVQSTESSADWHGTTDWFVKDIDLFTTTIAFAFTNETATVSNGSMANSRIMNGARSPEPYIYIVLRFGVDVTYGQLEIFREALARYVEARPRDWAKLWCFRAIDVRSDAGYVEYMVCVEARDTWQELFNIWHIRGQIKAFCFELSKQLDMRYVSPAMPVDLRMRGTLADALQEDENRRKAMTEGLSADSEAIQRIIQDRTR